MNRFRFVDTREPLLGTLVEIRLTVDRDDEAAAGAIVDDAFAEMVRLQSVLSAVDRSSELSRWSEGHLATTSAELTEVLNSAHSWQRASDGRFSPLTGLLTARWRRAEADGVEPSAEELAELVGVIASTEWRQHGHPDLQLNAYAKGWIVDRIAAHVMDRVDDGVVSVVVNAGGDLVHRGEGELEVGVEDPFLIDEGEPPLGMVVLSDAGLATSGRRRRGFQVGERWYSHVIDPRTGWPVDHQESITVVADHARTADVLCTVFGVEPIDDALADAERCGVRCVIIAPDGAVRTV